MDDKQYWGQRLDEFLDNRRDSGIKAGGVADDKSIVGQWINFAIEQSTDPAARNESLLRHWVTDVKKLTVNAQASYRAHVNQWWKWNEHAQASLNDEQVWMQRLNVYVRWCEEAGQATATLDTVRSVLGLWIPWALGQAIDPGEFGDEDIDAFCNSRDGVNSVTRTSYAGHIRRWRERLSEFTWADRGAAEVAQCWLVRAGSQGEAVEHNLRNDVVTIAWRGWGDWSDLEQCASRDEVNAFIDERCADRSEKDRRSARSNVGAFVADIQQGDLVVMPMKGVDGTPIAIGRVNGPFEFDPAQRDDVQKRRSVTWLRTEIRRDVIGQELLKSIDSPGTVFGLRKDNAARRVLHLAEHGTDPGPVDPEPPPVDPDFLANRLIRAARELLCEVEFLREIVDLLQDKGQVILYGPPGTGKTHFAQRLAQALTGNGSTAENVDQDWRQRLDSYCLHLEQDQEVQPATHRSIARRWIEFALDRELDPSAWDESRYEEFADLNPDWQEITRKTHRYDLLRWCIWASSSDDSRAGATFSLVQFHPAYSYEDFFEGFRPAVDEDGNMTYRLTPGPLMKIAAIARGNPDQRHVMVIDEINRANLPRVLGELLYLLEYRRKSIQTQYRPDGNFSLPKNLWFIGTMNTADRSIALIDAAMRRRFHFVPFFPHKPPTAGLLLRWTQRNAPEQGWVAELLDRVNGELEQALGGDHLLIGPSHFMKPGLDEASVRRIWEYNIEPLIEDQLFGQQEVISKFRFNAVWKRHGPAATSSGAEPKLTDEPGGDAVQPPNKDVRVEGQDGG